MKKILFIMISLSLIISCTKGNKSELISIPDYKKWKKPVNQIMDYPVPGHGSGYRIIYANDITFTASVSKDSRGGKKIVIPDGAYVIKESYKKRQDINKKVPVIYGMIKNRKSPDSVGGWVYFVKKPDDALKVVSTKMCSGCHEAANEKHPYFDGNTDDSFRDFLFAPVVKEN